MMRNTLTVLLIIAGALIAPHAPAAGPAVVTFVNSSQYTDAGAWGQARDANLAQLEAHVHQLAAKHLAPGQTLALEFLDVDLAGNVRPWKRSGTEVRVLRGRADWPRLALRYSLQEAGGGTRSGTESISDLNYLGRPGVRTSVESLAYEKRLLGEWFQSRFVAGQQTGN
jgi:Protein of unknown function (DUF3016)